MQKEKAPVMAFFAVASLYLYLRDNWRMQNSGFSQCWRGLEWCLTDQRIWRKIEVFLNGAGECANTPQHLRVSPED
ncbi:hypothetical protein [Escherichia coli]|uniref:hypothetical protein n=1 Tax=Escherichia coli TaxID=562 RepID=UPI0015629991|nr:hypothetical protein [Escherichia coli]EFK1902640.1 hypothetical protein [Escherichia coli]EIG8230817.1 hypothetical protein [Escherichia coli]EJH1088974.1 hypothetical protein [Escherichia coli]